MDSVFVTEEGMKIAVFINANLEEKMFTTTKPVVKDGLLSTVGKSGFWITKNRQRRESEAMLGQKCFCYWRDRFYFV